MYVRLTGKEASPATVNDVVFAAFALLSFFLSLSLSGASPAHSPFTTVPFFSPFLLCRRWKLSRRKNTSRCSYFYDEKALFLLPRLVDHHRAWEIQRITIGNDDGEIAPSSLLHQRIDTKCHFKPRKPLLAFKIGEKTFRLRATFAQSFPKGTKIFSFNLSTDS